MKWLILLLTCLPLAAVNANVFCYYLVDKDGNVTSYTEPPWDLSYPPAPISAEERLKRERLGHLVISVVEHCQTTGRKVSEITLAELEKKDAPPPAQVEAPTETVSVDIPISAPPKIAAAAPPPPVAPQSELPADSREVKIFRGQAQGLRAVAMDSGKIVSVDEAGSMIVWDVRGGHTLRNVTGIGVTRMQAQDGNIIVGLNSTADNLQVWDLNSGSPLRSLSGHEAQIRDLAVASSYLASTSLDNSVRLWDYHSGDAIHTLVPSGGVSADGMQAVAVNIARVAAASGKRIYVWSNSSGKEVRTWDAPDTVTAMVLNINNKLAVATENNPDISVWDSENGKLLHTLRGHELAVLALALSDTQLVSASADGTLKVWNIDNGSVQNTFSGHEGAVSAVAIQAQHIISGGQDKTVRLWPNHLQLKTEDSSVPSVVASAPEVEEERQESTPEVEEVTPAEIAAITGMPEEESLLTDENGAKNAVAIVQQAIEQQARNTQKLLTGFVGEWTLDMARTIEQAKLDAKQSEELEKLRRDLKIRINESEVIYVRGGDLETTYDYTLESGEPDAVILSTHYQDKNVSLTLTSLGDGLLNLKTPISPDLNTYVWRKDDGSEPSPAPKTLPDVFLGLWEVDIAATEKYFQAHSPKAAEFEQIKPSFAALKKELRLKFTDKEVVYVRSDRDNAYAYTLAEVAPERVTMTTIQGGKQMQIILELVDAIYLNFRLTGSDDLSYYLWRKP
jgi:WD40 repeat protein